MQAQERQPQFGMSGTLGNEIIVSSFSQVVIMKILVIEKRVIPFPYMFTRTWQGMFPLNENKNITY
ncbi:MAG: hypothetical protein EGP82_10065 [Odoribacter splanchnicus]|nr:hypothetical protein [Odoribacter splanchnicus]